MLIDPVEITSMGAIGPRCPRRMIDPLPNCFSIWPTAMSSALVRSFTSSKGMRFSSGRVAKERRQGVPVDRKERRQGVPVDSVAVGCDRR
ncbi:MAG: hypothetical protein ACREBP_05425, partial [Sphingomicrobium sp.]